MSEQVTGTGSGARVGIVMGSDSDWPVMQAAAEALALADVEVEAELLGDASLVITPGPVEQILDEVLAAVLAHRGRLARLVVDAEERHVRVTVGLVGAVVTDTDGDAARPLARARTVVETVGGRMSGSLLDDDGLVVVLPRR